MAQFDKLYIAKFDMLYMECVHFWAVHFLLTLYHTILTFNDLEKKIFGKH